MPETPAAPMPKRDSAESSMPPREDRHRHRALIAVRAQAMLASFWQDDEPDAVRAIQIETWCDVLEPLTQDEIRQAMADYMKEGPRTAKGVLVRPDPGAIFKRADKMRQWRMIAARNAQPDATRSLNELPPTAEDMAARRAKIAKIMREAGFRSRFDVGPETSAESLRRAASVVET